MGMFTSIYIYHTLILWSYVLYVLLSTFISHSVQGTSTARQEHFRIFAAFLIAAFLPETQ